LGLRHISPRPRERELLTVNPQECPESVTAGTVGGLANPPNPGGRLRSSTNSVILAHNNFVKEGLIQRFFARFNPQSAPDIVSLEIGVPRDISYKYPNVPSPESSLAPQLLAAAWKTHDLYGEDMPEIAADLLEAGYDTPSLRRLAGEIGITCSADVEDILAEVFRELNIRYPLSEMQATLIVSRQVAREVIAGRRDAGHAAAYFGHKTRWDSRAPEDLRILFALNDELSWDPGRQRFVTPITGDFYDVFARIASITDEQIFAEERATS